MPSSHGAGLRPASWARFVRSVAIVAAAVSLIAPVASPAHATSFAPAVKPGHAKVLRSLPPNYRPDLMMQARQAARTGPDGSVDLTALQPNLPDFLPWTGCSTTGDGILCWGHTVGDTVEAGDFDVCADGRTIHQNSSEDTFFVRFYGLDGKLRFRGTDHRFSYFRLSFSTDARSGVVLNDFAVFNKQLWMDTPGVISGTTTFSGVTDYAVSPKGHVIIAGYGLRQEDADFATLATYQTGRWDLWDDYAASIQRTCDALDGKT